MPTDPTTRVFALAARDLVVAVSASEAFAPLLEGFARRRTPTYAPGVPALADEAYWPAMAVALAPLAPPEGMPMAGLIAAGVTLEGGPRGVRGWFTSAPSDKDRKRVGRIATLASRVMDIVAGADNTLTDDERRGITMAMASFGLDSDELAAIRTAEKLTVANLEIFGELDTRIRKELVRGAWQLCLRGTFRPSEEEAIRAVSIKLDLTEQSAILRTEVESQMARLGDTAALAVELTRTAGRSLADEKLAPCMDHLIRAMAPPTRAVALRARVKSGAAAQFESAWRGLDRGRRVQAVALAWATLIATDPSYSASLHLRAVLTTAAGDAGAAYELTEALDAVDRYLHQRISEAHAPTPVPES